MPVNHTKPTKRYYSATDLRHLLGVSDYTLDKWLAAGVLPKPVRPGGERGKRMWPVEMVDKCLAEMSNQVASA
jgi:hypothetical protein